MFLVQKMDNSLIFAFGQLINKGKIVISIDKKNFIEHHFSKSDFEKIKLSKEITSRKVIIELKYENIVERRTIYS
jgi:hypothetical protein